tara:strand:+ start:851 stop:1195 length:345 start_codon:yes stop_codon:yes gene_type:complete
MDTDEHDSGLTNLSGVNRTLSKGILLKDGVYAILGCAIEVLNFLGHGFHEKPYENALTVEFKLREIPHLQQPALTFLTKIIKLEIMFLALLSTIQLLWTQRLLNTFLNVKEADD